MKPENIKEWFATFAPDSSLLPHHRSQVQNRLSQRQVNLLEIEQFRYHQTERHQITPSRSSKMSPDALFYE